MKSEPSPERANQVEIPADDPELQIMTAQDLASGLTAVWARENTREALFDAMRRKEVYATTGTRIRVRVFGGWDFEADEVTTGLTSLPRVIATWRADGWRRSSRRPMAKLRAFMIRAVRDPDGANLDRVQVIKGWLDPSDGETHERIYDVAVSDGRGSWRRTVAAREEVGSTVDVATRYLHEHHRRCRVRGALDRP